jgi:CRISPR/Cas system-associated endonuclease Cas3-HD
MYNTLIKWGVVVLALVCSHYTTYYLGKTEAQREVVLAHKVYEAKLNMSEEQHEQAIAKLNKERDEEITSITVARDNIIRSLQQRSSRTENANNNPTIESSCTGRELYKEDGEFLVRVAREADELRSALKQCYTQYEALRK